MKKLSAFHIAAQIFCMAAALFFLAPLILMLVQSFGKNGIANYKRVFESVNLLPNFFTSIVVVFGTLLLVSVVTSFAAFAFSKIDFWAKNTIYYILLTGMMIPTAAIIFPLFQTVKLLGLNNTPFSLVFPYATLNSIFNLMVLKNYYDGLPNELIDAAYIDGAGAWRVFYSIMFPISIPGMTIVLIQTFLSAWNELQMAMIFINRPEVQPVSVVPLRFMQSVSSTFPIGVMYACLVICLFPIVVFDIVAQRFLIQGLTQGAVKG